MRGLIEGLDTPVPIITTLPAIYQEDAFAAQLTSAFDEVLAPVISTLDNLDAYVDPELAPRDFVEWLGRWVGFPVGETWPEDRARHLVGRAVELYRWRGTAKGLRDLLTLYAGIEPEIIESGGVSWSTTPGSQPRSGAPARPVKATAKAKGATRRGTAKSAKKDELEAEEAPADEGPRLVVRVRGAWTGGVDRRQLEALINAAKPAHLPHVIEVLA